MIGEGDLDPSEGQSQPLVGTLPLTEEDTPEKPEDKDPPPTQSKLKKESERHLPKTTKDTSLRDPFSSFWSGKLGDVSDQSGRRHRC